jgi:hypothetical protein
MLRIELVYRQGYIYCEYCSQIRIARHLIVAILTSENRMNQAVHIQGPLGQEVAVRTTVVPQFCFYKAFCRLCSR